MFFTFHVILMQQSQISKLILEYKSPTASVWTEISSLYNEELNILLLIALH